MLTLLLVAFPLLLLLGVLAAGRLERFIDRQPRRHVVATSPPEEAPQVHLSTATPIAR